MDTLSAGISLAQPIALICLLIIAPLILYFRGARYIFLDRIWGLLHRKGFYDDQLRSYHENQLDIERFKFMHGIHSIENKAEVYDAIAWADQIGITLRSMCKARGWVNWKARLVKKPSKFGNVGWGLLYVVACLATCIPFAWALSGDMLVQFKDSKSWVWVDEHSARAVPFLVDKSWVLRKDDCQPGSSETNKTTLEPEEVQKLCENFGTLGLATQVSQTVYMQRWIMGLLTVFMLWPIWLIFTAFIARISALDVKRRIDKVRERTVVAQESSHSEFSQVATEPAVDIKPHS